jgi:hypothetical protein
MAREGRNEDNQVQHRPQVLRRAFWVNRQLDLFQADAARRALNPYALHLQRMRDMRAQERHA